MLLVIGTENCSKCLMTKNILDSKGIEYTYQLLNSLSKHEQDIYLDMAQKVKQMSMPLIIKDGQIITLQEV